MLCRGTPVGFTYSFGVFEAQVRSFINTKFELKLTLPLQYHLYEFPDSSPTLISFIGSTNIAVTLSSCVIFGRIAEIYGYRLIAALGLLLYVVSLIGASFSPSAAGLVGLQGVFHGVAQACLFLAATAIPAPYFNARLSVAMGVRSLLFILGLYTRTQTVAVSCLDCRCCFRLRRCTFSSLGNPFQRATNLSQ